jgi:hypothetical protein
VQALEENLGSSLLARSQKQVSLTWRAKPTTILRGKSCNCRKKWKTTWQR